MSEGKCNCDVCKYSDQYKYFIQHLDGDAKLFFEDMYSRLIHVEYDWDVDKAIISGQWPDADARIKATRDALKKELKVHPGEDAE